MIGVTPKTTKISLLSFILQEETTIQHQKEKEQRKLNAMGDENFIPTKNVAGPPVFYPQGEICL